MIMLLLVLMHMCIKIYLKMRLLVLCQERFSPIMVQKVILGIDDIFS